MNSTQNPLEKPLSFVRNNINVVMQVFEGKKEKSKWYGRKFQAPQVETDGTDSAPADDKVFLASMTLLGKENVLNSMNAVLKRYGQDFILDATNEEGVFDVDKYIGYWVNLTSAALSKAELEESRDQVVNELNELMFTMISNKQRLNEDPVFLAELTATAERLQKRSADLRKALDDRKARRSKEENSETVMAAS
jgi:hypothetical protein